MYTFLPTDNAQANYFRSRLSFALYRLVIDAQTLEPPRPKFSRDASVCFFFGHPLTGIKVDAVALRVRLRRSLQGINTHLSHPGGRSRRMPQFDMFERHLWLYIYIWLRVIVWLCTPVRTHLIGGSLVGPYKIAL